MVTEKSLRLDTHTVVSKYTVQDIYYLCIFRLDPFQTCNSESYKIKRMSECLDCCKLVAQILPQMNLDFNSIS